jgi:hypothetical protein
LQTDWGLSGWDVLVLSFRNQKPASIGRAHVDSLDGMASTNSTIQVLFSNCYEIQILIQFFRSLKNSILKMYVSIYRIEKQGIDHVLTLLGT